MKTWIKFCGTTSLEDALAAIDAGADALGFIFAPSKRSVRVEHAQEIISSLPPGVERIGVFVDEWQVRVRAICQLLGLTAVQLHGKESPEYVGGLTSFRPRLRVIKGLQVGRDLGTALERLGPGAGGAESILLDSGAGSGKTFDWQSAKAQLGGRSARFIIAGGLNAENVGEAIRVFSPWGVDAVSGIEREPGRKDPEKMKAFVAAVREAEQ